MDFQTSFSFIWAASWLTESNPNFLKIDAELILSLILVLLISLSILFWVVCSAFIMAVVGSVSISLTLEQSWRPYLNLLIHKLWTTVINFYFGSWFAILLITKSLWFKLVFNKASNKN